MNLLFLDFETYYDQNYSLKKLSPPEYILSDKFEMILCACAVNGEPSHAVEGNDFPAYLKQFDPANTTTVTFNSLFDNSILAWRYGFVPRRMVDTIGLARALLGHELRSFSLDSVATHLNLGAKGTALPKMAGLHAADIKAPRGWWDEFSAYANQDNELNRKIFLKLYPKLPKSERRIMDLVLRAAIEPRFQLDVDMLKAHLETVKAEKAALLAKYGGDVGTLMSTAKFKQALEDLGVEIETKISPTTGKAIPAFSRIDSFMEQLQEHPDERVQAIARARLGHRSTIEEKRCEKLIRIAELPWENFGLPKHSTPIPLRYGGTHTHRLSGEWGVNMQNMPTARGSKGKSRLRLAQQAPVGHSVIVADLGQIEARLGGWISNCTPLVKQFAEKLDPYSMLAEAIFGRKINRKLQGTSDEAMGFIGKTGILGLGYGAGANKFHTMVHTLARSLGVDLTLIGGFDFVKADMAVQTYRNMYGAIRNTWYLLDGHLRNAWLGRSAASSFGPVVIGMGCAALPTGPVLRYADPKLDHETGEHTYRYGKFTHKIYGAKMLENIVQYLARIVVMDAAVRLADRGLRFALQAHDELVFIVPDEGVEDAKAVIHEEMTRCPDWAPGLPLTADVGAGPNYGEAKT